MDRLRDSLSSFELLNKIINTNNYKSKNWNLELATRYVFKVNNKVVEASYFRHFKDNTYVKSAIELPISYGCKISCKHCASSIINSYVELNEDEISALYTAISNEHDIKATDKILVTFSGIGEGFMQRNTIKNAALKIFSLNNNVHFNFTTVGFDVSFIEYCANLTSIIPVHFLQISYLNYDKYNLSKVIPTATNYEYDVKSIINTIKSNPQIHCRINYVVIKNYNDTIEHYSHVAELFSEIRHLVVFRVSNLNETVASKLNNLEPVTDDVLEKISNYLSMQYFEAYVFASSANDNLNCGQLVWEYTARAN